MAIHTVTHRFVVPSVFVLLLRAEQTTATRLSPRLALGGRSQHYVGSKGECLFHLLHDVFHYAVGPFAHTGPPKLLHNPFAVAVVSDECRVGA